MAALANGPYQNPPLGQVDHYHGQPQGGVLEHGEFQQVKEEPQGPGQAEEDDSPVLQININNVVCSFSTRCHLNLRKIAMEGMHVILRKESGMVSMKLRNPYTTASVWSSGKITVTGATSEEASKVAARRIARRLQNWGFRTKVANFRVVNVLGTCSFPFGIKIQSFSKTYPREASYEPELHPGVTYRIKEPKATLKIFSTGSITVTAPRVINVQLAIQHIYPLVYDFQMEKPHADVNIKEELPEECLPEVFHAAKRPLNELNVPSEGSNVTKKQAAATGVKKRYQPLANYKSLKRPKEDWSDTSEDDFDSDDSNE